VTVSSTPSLVVFLHSIGHTISREGALIAARMIGKSLRP